MFSRIDEAIAKAEKRLKKKEAKLARSNIEKQFIDLGELEEAHAKCPVYKRLQAQKLLGALYYMRAKAYDKVDRKKEALADYERAMNCLPDEEEYRKQKKDCADHLYQAHKEKEKREKAKSPPAKFTMFPSEALRPGEKPEDHGLKISSGEHRRTLEGHARKSIHRSAHVHADLMNLKIAPGGRK